MSVTQVTLSSKHQIVVPREARRALGLKPGDKLLIVALGGNVLVMKRPRSHAAALKGTAKGLYPKGYLESERGEWNR